MVAVARNANGKRCDGRCGREGPLRRARKCWVSLPFATRKSPFHEHETGGCARSPSIHPSTCKVLNRSRSQLAGTPVVSRSVDDAQAGRHRSKAGQVDHASRALRRLAATYLGCKSGEHCFDLELASCPLLKLTSTSHRMLAGFGCIHCIWCIWWLQQHGGQQQCGQLFGVPWLVCLVAAVLASVVGRRMEVAGWSFCDLVCVGQPCSHRMILPSSSGPFSPPPPWFWTLGGSVLACVARCARTCAVAVAAWPLWRSRWIARSWTPLAASNGPRNSDLHVCDVCV